MEKDINKTEGILGSLLRKDQVMGMTVIGLDAKTVGTVQDLPISSQRKVVIEVKRQEGFAASTDSAGNGDTLFLSPEEVLAVGDVALLRHSSALAGKKASIPASASQMSSTPVKVRSSFPPVLVPSSASTEAQNSSAREKICGRCNFLNFSNSRFCIKCGNPLP